MKLKQKHTPKQNKKSIFNELFYNFFGLKTLSDIEKEKELLTNNNFLNSQNYIKDSDSIYYYSINEYSQDIGAFTIFFSLILVFILIIISALMFGDNNSIFLFLGVIFQISLILFFVYYGFKRINSYIYSKFYRIYYKKPNSIISKDGNDVNSNDLMLIFNSYGKSEADFNKLSSKLKNNKKNYFLNNFIIIKNEIKSKD